MGFLGKLFGGGDPSILAPVAGEAVPLHEVSDPTFGEEILGKGVAIRPTGNTITAPCDGTIALMFETGHAVSIEAACGADVLIHVGLDTVNLKGKHYTVHAKTGDTIKAGQLLITFDREAITAEGYDIITPVIICNSDEYAAVKSSIGPVAVGDKLIVLHK